MNKLSFCKRLYIQYVNYLFTKTLEVLLHLKHKRACEVILYQCRRNEFVVNAQLV